MTHTREVEPLNVALVVIAADHLPVGDLLAQTVGGLIGVDGEVHWRGVSLLLGFPLADKWVESRLSLFRWRLGRRLEVRSGAGDSWMLDQSIWLTTWIFSSPSSWLRISALCSWICSRFL
uniref:Uncharacterized protein n=1 Tax=Xiphophorus maculatus TaxID=8083 RepID=A0A3B5QB52_XIPMA